MDDDFQDLHPAIRGLKTVCRCNSIKYRTIERCIEQGARSIGDVAARTGATTGHCGGTCTPRVQEMIDERVAPRETVRPPATQPSPDDSWWAR